MNNRRTVIDLFSGVGGLSLGAARADFTLGAAVELDRLAIATHAVNFPHSKHYCEDVQSIDGRDLLERAGLRNGELTGLIGGPPCQGFSDIGLRAERDPRNQLFVHFFRLVAETNPSFFLAENVPGLLQERNSEFREAALSALPSRYRVLDPFIVKANEYGVPTTRRRVFFVGYDPDRVGTLAAELFAPPKRIKDVRVADALEGLPRLRSDWQTEEQSWRAVGSLDDSEFAQRVTDRVPVGVGDPAAINIYRKNQRASGFLGTRHSPETVKRFARLRPGEADRISKCVRLDRNGFCPTLRAGTGADRGSYQAIRPVHPGSPRVINPREAARLQGFPDWFQFHPTKWHAFRQIGNSVSPIVAEQLLRVIRSAL